MHGIQWPKPKGQHSGDFAARMHDHVMIDDLLDDLSVAHSSTCASILAESVSRGDVSSSNPCLFLLFPADFEPICCSTG